MAFHVYMAASRPRGVICVGMTSDLAGRAWEHRERVVEGFTKRYWVGRLVYFEEHETAALAQRREWLMKRWRREARLLFGTRNLARPWHGPPILDLLLQFSFFIVHHTSDQIIEILPPANWY